MLYNIIKKYSYFRISKFSNSYLFKSVVFLILILILVTSCQDELIFIPNDEVELNRSILSENDSYDDAIIKLSWLFSASVYSEHEEILTKIEEILNTDEIPKNSLFQIFENLDENSLQRLIETYQSKIEYTFPKSDNYKEILNKYPLITLDFNENENSVFDAKRIKKVTFVDSKFDSKNKSSFGRTIHISKGDVTNISPNSKAPNMFLIRKSETNHKIILSNNDELEVVKKVDNYQKLFETKYFTIYTYSYFIISSDNPKVNAELNRTSCLRDLRNHYEYISKIKLNSTSVYRNINSWTEGRYFEFEIICLYGENNFGSWSGNDLKKNVSIKKSALGSDPKWTYLSNWIGAPGTSGLNFINWNPNVNGNKVKYRFTEIDDNDLSVKINTCFTIAYKKPDGSWSIGTNVCVEIGTNSKNDNLGEDLVYYCDDSAWPGAYKNTGSLSFYVGD